MPGRYSTPAGLLWSLQLLPHRQVTPDPRSPRPSLVSPVQCLAVALSDAVTSILEAVTRQTSIAVDVVVDPGLKVPGRVQMARGKMPSHIATYNPSLDTHEYYLAFEAAFILRLFDTPPSSRVLFAGTGEGMAELARLPLTAPLAMIPAPARQQLHAQLHDGLLTQLRSQPIGMRINEWLRHEYPQLHDVQQQGIDNEQRQAAQTVGPEIRLLSPSQVWEASTGMNAAVALFTDRLLGHQRYAVPFRAAGIEARGRALLALWDGIGADPEHDRERVDSWAVSLGLSAWYKWVPLP
jgi:hypothetical protein